MLAEFSIHSLQLNPVLEMEESKEDQQRCKLQQHFMAPSTKDFVITTENGGSLEVDRARSWSWSHFLCNLLMCACVITGDSLLTTYSTDTSLQSIAMWLAWSTMVLGFMSALCTACFLRPLATRQPSPTAHFVVKFLLLLHWTLNVVAVFFVTTIPISLSGCGGIPSCCDGRWTGPHWLLVATQGVYVFGIVVMIVELFVCLGLLVMGPVGVYKNQAELCCCAPVCLYKNSVDLEIIESQDFMKPCEV